MSYRTVDPPPTRRKKALKTFASAFGVLVGVATLFGTVAGFGQWLFPVDRESPVANTPPAGGGPTSKPQGSPPAQFRPGTISNVGDGLVLTISSHGDGTPNMNNRSVVIVTTYNPDWDRQVWMRPQDNGEDRRLVSAVNHDKVMEMNPSEPRKAQIDKFHEHPNQYWRVDPATAGSVNLYNPQGEGCLTSNGMDKIVTVTPCELDNRSQLWILH